MTHGVTRREVFQSTLAAAGLAASGHLVPSRVEAAQPAAGSTERIAVDPEILPLVQLLEKAAPDKTLIPVAVEQLARAAVPAAPGRGLPAADPRRLLTTTSGSSTRATRRAWT